MPEPGDLSEPPAIPTHDELQQRLDDGPLDHNLWSDLYRAAEVEEQQPQSGYLKDVPASALIRLADAVRAQPDSISRYALVTAPSPREGSTWFDVLEGFSNNGAIEFIADFVAFNDWDNVVDLGTGTGKLARAVSHYCASVTGVDRSSAMLDLAKRIPPSENFGIIDYKEADVLATGIVSATVDGVVSLGLLSSFPKGKLGLAATEIARILKPGGSYLECFGGVEEARAILSTVKGLLADAIVETVSGSKDVHPDENWDTETLVDAFAKSGLIQTDLHQSDDLAYMIVEFVKKAT